MPRICILCLLFLAAVLLGAACAGAKNPAMADLLRRRFVLVSVDGIPFAATQQPDIAFDGDFRVSGRICNRYTGQATLENGVLSVKQMASTKMLCLDAALNRFESQFAAMLHAGARADLTGDTLTLRHDNHSFLYTSADRAR